MRRVAKLFSSKAINTITQQFDYQMKNKRFEIRTTGALTADNESRKIGGLAIAVESKSELLGGAFYETIKRSAVDEALIKSNDIKLYMNHDSTQGTIARSKFGNGSLRLFVTDRGLEFETEVPDTEKGNEVLEGIRRGDIDACSFAMIPDSVTWSELDNNLYQRDINSFKVVDEISILSCLPAYSATEVDMRSLDDFKSYEETRAEDEKPADKPEEEEENAARDNASEEENKPEEEEQKAEQDEKEDAEEEDRMLSEYYTSLRALIK